MKDHYLECSTEETGGSKDIQAGKREGTSRSSNASHRPEAGCYDLNLNNPTVQQFESVHAEGLVLSGWCQGEGTGSSGFQSHK